jgi:hypothetical protein
VLTGLPFGETGESAMRSMLDMVEVKPELLPGAQHSFAILENPDRKPDPDTTRVYPGELVSDGYVGVYTVMEAAVWPDGNGYSRDETDSELLCRRSLLDACRNDWPEYNAFHYVTFTDQIALPALTLNGTEVTRSAATAVIDVNFNYQAIGKSGLVRLSRGMVPIYHAEVDEKGQFAFQDVPAADYYVMILDPNGRESSQNLTEKISRDELLRKLPHTDEFELFMVGMRSCLVQKISLHNNQTLKIRPGVL